MPATVEDHLEQRLVELFPRELLRTSRVLDAAKVKTPPPESMPSPAPAATATTEPSPSLLSEPLFWVAAAVGVAAAGAVLAFALRPDDDQLYLCVRRDEPPCL